MKGIKFLAEEIGHLINDDSEVDALDYYSCHAAIAQTATQDDLAELDYEIVYSWLSAPYKELQDDMRADIARAIISVRGEKILADLKQYKAEQKGEYQCSKERAAHDAGVAARGEI